MTKKRTPTKTRKTKAQKLAADEVARIVAEAVPMKTPVSKRLKAAARRLRKKANEIRNPPQASMSGGGGFFDSHENSSETRFQTYLRRFPEDTANPTKQIGVILASRGLTELRALHAAKVAYATNVNRMVILPAWGSQHLAIFESVVEHARQLERVTVLELVKDVLDMATQATPEAKNEILDMIRQTALKLGKTWRDDLNLPELEQTGSEENTKVGYQTPAVSVKPSSSLALAD